MVGKTKASTQKFKTFREAATKFLTEETKSSLSRDAAYLANLDSLLGPLTLVEIH